MSIMNPYNYKKAPGAVTVKVTSDGAANNANVKANSKLDVYLEQKIMNAKPEELTLMLYEGIVKFVKQSIVFNEQREFEKSNNSNIRAQHIVEELRATLDMNIEMSIQLESLYIFMHQRLVEANIGKSNDILQEVLQLAVELRDVWKEAMHL